jgi:hypothetical protein
VARALVTGLAALMLIAAPAVARAADAPVPPKKLEGVVVIGKPKPMRQCAAKDTPCVEAVMAQLKQRFPEQLKVWCFRQKMQQMRDSLNAATLYPDGPATQLRQADVIKTVCAPDTRR